MSAWFQSPIPLPDVPSTIDGIILLIGLGLGYAVFQNAGTLIKALIARYQSGTNDQIMRTDAFRTLLDRVLEAEKKADESEERVRTLEKKCEIMQAQLDKVSSESTEKDAVIAAQQLRIDELKAEVKVLVEKLGDQGAEQ